MKDRKKVNQFIHDHMLQPLALGSFWNWMRLLRENRGIDPPYIGRALYVSLISLLTSPLRYYQHMRMQSRVEEVKIRRPPVFILGHWRSGTTYLHNLLCQDPRLGYVSSLQVIAPEMFFVAGEAFKSLLRWGTPETRLIDNMTWSIDSPQEEEMAIGNVSPYTLYHLFSFPRNARNYFDRYVLFRGISDKVLADWKEKYLQVLRMATLNMSGRRLVIKNPVNTARIRLLLELFPQAKFIHLHRDPYRVFVSTRNLYQKTLEISQLQAIGLDEIEALILYFYRELMQQYLQDRSLIPPENLVELSYEELDRSPIRALNKVYTRIKLRRFPRARLEVRRYLADLKGYQKNEYMMTAGDLVKVNRAWAFSFKAFDYPMRSALSA